MLIVKMHVVFSSSDIFDAMSLVKHSAGETVIQQGKARNVLIYAINIFAIGFFFLLTFSVCSSGSYHHFPPLGCSKCLLCSTFS